MTGYGEGSFDLGGGCYAWLLPDGHWGESNTGLTRGRGESMLVDTLYDYVAEEATARFEAGFAMNEAVVSIDRLPFDDVSEQGRRITANVLHVYQLDSERPGMDQVEQFGRTAAFELSAVA
jgi:hypothetical protein